MGYTVTSMWQSDHQQHLEREVLPQFVGVGPVESWSRHYLFSEQEQIAHVVAAGIDYALYSARLVVTERVRSIIHLLHNLGMRVQRLVYPKEVLRSEVKTIGRFIWHDQASGGSPVGGPWLNNSYVLAVVK